MKLMPKFIFHDLSYSFNRDNPFMDDGNKQRLNTLRQMVDANLAIDFADIDRDINYYNLKEDIGQLYGDDSLEKDVTELSLIDDMKDVVEKIPQLVAFNEWCKQFPRHIVVHGGKKDLDPPSQPSPSSAVVEEAPSPPVFKPIEPIDDDTSFEGVIPIQPSKFDYTKTNGLTNYDITTDKPLSYDDVRHLTVNIARSKLKTTVEKSEQIIALEKEKRKELVNNIQKYRNINAIGVLVEDNIHDMNLSQLEHTLTYCEKLYQSQKLKEVIKRGANFGSLITSTIFPNGIKLGKSKRVNFKGTAKTIIENIFDTQSTIGVAFQNIIDKHHWNITDEAVLLLSIGEMFVSSVKIENTQQSSETKTEAKPPSEHASEEYEEEDDEEEEEEDGEADD